MTSERTARSFSSLTAGVAVFSALALGQTAILKKHLMSASGDDMNPTLEQQPG